MKQSKTILENTIVSIMLIEPDMLNRKPNFSMSELKTPFGDWKMGKELSYTIQYKQNYVYSKFGPWSSAYIVQDKACPYLFIPTDIENRTRLIYRKFKNEKPQLVGILKRNEQTNFYDIERDIFNAVADLNEDLSLNETEKFVGKFNMNVKLMADRTLLHIAASVDNIDFANKFILSNQSIDINQMDINGFTPLHISAHRSYGDFMETLLKNQANVNMKNDINGQTALHVASFFNSDETIISLLLQNNSTDVNAKDKTGFTPLHNAVFGGVRVVRALLANKQTNINIRSKTGLTPLHLAVLIKDAEVVKELLKYEKLDGNAKSIGGYTALHFVAITKDEEIFFLLFDKTGINFNAIASNYGSPLHLAILNEFESMIEALLNNNKSNVNVKTEDMITPLHLAVKSNITSLVTLLIQKGAEINAQTIEGLTPLHIAAKYGNYNIVKYLIKNGANMELRANFMFFDGNGQQSIFVIDNNCKRIETVKYKQLTVLLLAATSKSKNSNSILEYLIKSGANTKAVSDNGKGYEFLAAEYGNKESVDFAIEKSSTEIKDRDMNSLLHSAIKVHNMAAIKYLIERKKIDVNVKNRKGETPLHIASLNGDLQIVKYLIENGAKINIISSCENNVLHYAAQCGSLEINKYLIDQGIDIKKRNCYSHSPIDKAALCNNSVVLNYLIKEKGLSVQITNTE